MNSRLCGNCCQALLALSLVLLGQDSRPDVRAQRPPGARIKQQIQLDIGDEGTTALALVYAIPDPSDRVFHTDGVRILKKAATGRWSSAFDEHLPKMRDNDTTSIEELVSAAGQKAVVVITFYSGAGTATSWHVLASVDGKISILDPERDRKRALRDKGYQDWGYNKVTVQGDSVIEVQPGYSHHTARCCPDRPSIEMVFRFTGRSILLEGIKELPFAPSR